MQREITCRIPESLHATLLDRMQSEGVSCDHLVSRALADFLATPMHTLFQVSTSAALVKGLFQGVVKTSDLLRHGDFGLGTFADLDGELVLLDGVCYQITSQGHAQVVEGDRKVPYAAATRFEADVARKFSRIDSLSALESVCDQLRPSDNVFYAFRIEGRFRVLHARAVKPVHPGVGIKDAAATQDEFSFSEIQGTLVGIWSPEFANAFSIPGYHFHFLSADRQRGGHLLDCEAAELEVQGCSINEMYISLPATEDFLRADLSRSNQNDLLDAERSQPHS